jgi:hypothetical protein
MFSTSCLKETLQEPFYSINVSGSVCVTVCGLSAGCLRHVSMDADLLASLKNNVWFFSE